MTAIYNKSSPWFLTPRNNLYLENMVYREIPQSEDDPLYEVEAKYRHRPDLLAYDLYGDPKLWWVFVHRNRGLLEDPVFDLQPGLKIRLPRKEQLLEAVKG
jgi:hypothetical protein